MFSSFTFSFQYTTINLLMSYIFQGLFKNFDEAILESFRPHIERLIADTSADKHDNNQRFASEIVAGLIRGCKHWGFERSQRMWDWLLPLIKQMLKSMSNETVGFWGTCFATSSVSEVT